MCRYLVIMCDKVTQKYVEQNVHSCDSEFQCVVDLVLSRGFVRPRVREQERVLGQGGRLELVPVPSFRGPSDKRPHRTRKGTSKSV